MARVALRGLCKTWPDGTRALAPLDLDVEDGELLVLLGPSGCGKSTLLRLVAGLDAPSAGEVCFDGRAVTAEGPEARNVAMVFQDYALYPQMTVRQNLEFPLRMRRLGAGLRHERVARVAAMLGLDALLERRPAALSGGQRQRVAMGRALVREPAVFLLDEPLSNLDAALRQQIRVEIAELQRRLGTTTIHVTHDQVEAMTLGHRVAIFTGGELQQHGTPRAVYEAPANAWVAGFIGSPPMRLVPGEILALDGRRLTLALAGEALAPGVSACTAAALAGAGRGPITVGVRAEALTPVDPGQPGALAVVVLEVEHLGHEDRVRVRSAGGAELDLRLPGDARLRRGEALTVAVRIERLHLYAADGLALPRVPEVHP